jgi:protein-disulfide isomerase
VIQLYADFQCPACKQFVVEQLPRLVSDFVRPGTVRIEAEDIDILGSGAVNESVELAAGAYCAAEQNRYWQYHDLAFWNQGRENRGDHSAAFIERVANQAGVDVASWQTCFARSDVRQPARDRTAAALARGINSTPTLVVNGHALASGVPDYASLSAMIRQLAVSASSASGPSTEPSPLATTSAVPS